tara:strand:+ start:2277 stop:2978 length:702 start_codon:yes stop_codon:yes gene_type:complete
MKIGDKLLKLGYINKKQLTSALKKQSKEKILYNKDLQLGKILLDKEFLSLDELTEALSTTIEEEVKEVKQEVAMPTEIGEGSKFTFDLKFIITIGAVLVSGAGIYFTMENSINDLKSADSPSRLEYNVLLNEITSIKNAGNLDVITYKLEEYDDTFKELKSLSSTLTPLASDLDYLKKEINNLKNKEIEIPVVDLSSLENKILELSTTVNNMSTTINEYKDKVDKLEKVEGRF